MANVKSVSEDDIELLRRRLWQAAREGHVDDVSLLSIHFTGDVDTLSKALDWASGYGQLNVVTWLAEHHILRDDGECMGQALMRACMYSHWNIVRWLVNKTRVDVNHASFSDNNGILHCVISFSTTNPLLKSTRLSNMTELCRLVYVCSEDVNVQNKDGDTPLHSACYNDSSDIVGALLLAGADETITNDLGETPVQVAVQVAVQWAVRVNSVKILPLLNVSSK